MDQETKEALEELDGKVSAIWVSVEKTRRYFLITMWSTVIAFVLPVVILAFVIPSFLSSYTSTLNLDSLDSLNAVLAP